MQLASMS